MWRKLPDSRAEKTSAVTLAVMAFFFRGFWKFLPGLLSSGIIVKPSRTGSEPPSSWISEERAKKRADLREGQTLFVAVQGTCETGSCGNDRDRGSAITVRITPPPQALCGRNPKGG